MSVHLYCSRQFCENRFCVNLSKGVTNFFFTFPLLIFPDQAFKYCTEEGEWWKHPQTNLTWSNYTNCVDFQEYKVGKDRQADESWSTEAYKVIPFKTI